MFKKIILLALIAVVISLFVGFDLGQYLSLAALNQHRAELDQFYQQQPALMLIGFFLAYVLVTGFSLPGAAIMTVAAGALFGVLTGTLLVSFASSLGATAAFLFSRFLFRDSIQKRFHKQLESINQGLVKEGAWYLFTLRLVPLFPFFVINLVMGITQIRSWTFYWVSQLGMLAGTVVYVNAGTQLSKIQQLGDVLSPLLIASFVALGVFPLAAKKLVEWVKKSKPQT